MKYFYLKYHSPTEKSSTQISQISTTVDVNDDRGIYAFGRIDFPEINEIKYLILEKGAALKDILNTVMLRLSGLLVNEKAKNVISKYNLPPHKYYPALIKDHEGNVFSYYWLQTSKERDMKSYIDFKQTQFYIQKDMLGIDKESINIHSNKELESAKKQLQLEQAIKISKLVLNQNFSQLKIDLFKVSRLSIDWIISERLKEELEQANVTGISIKPINNLDVAK